MLLPPIGKCSHCGHDHSRPYFRRIVADVGREQMAYNACIKRLNTLANITDGVESETYRKAAEHIRRMTEEGQNA